MSAGEFVMMFVGSSAGVSITGIPTPAGASQTWFRPSVQFGAQFPDLTPVGTRRFAVFCAFGVNGSGAITLNPFNETVDANWCIVKFTGVDATNPFVYATMLGTASNATQQQIYARQFLDATNNASVACIMTGNGSDNMVAGTGYTMLAHTNVAPSSLPTIGIEWHLGEDLNTAAGDWTWTWPVSASNIAFFHELRAAGSAANAPLRFVQIGRGPASGSAGTHSLTTAFGAAPTYAAADVIYLAVFTHRTGATPLTSTVAGGAVTWVQHSGANITFDNDGTRDIKRLTVFRAMGPLDGSDVVVTHGEAQTAFMAIMVAAIGADESGANAANSIVQVVAAAGVATAVASATLAANAHVNNGVLAFMGSDTSGGGASMRTIPGNGLVTVDHLDQDGGREPFQSQPGRLYGECKPYNATVCSATFGASGDVAAIALEIKAA